MQYKVYENGELINTIVADSAFSALYAAGHGYTLEEMPESEPEETTPEPTEADDTAAMLVDHEYRLTLLELGLSE